MNTTGENKIDVLAKMSGLPLSQTRAEMLGDIVRDGRHHFRSDGRTYGRRKLDAAHALRDAGVIQFERRPEFDSGNDNWYTVVATPAALARIGGAK